VLKHTRGYSKLRFVEHRWLRKEEALGSFNGVVKSLSTEEQLGN
jgi:hypothetical protein